MKQEQDKIKYQYIEEVRKLQETQVPIRKGCPNKVCFCTGECQEIIGWRDKLPGEDDFKQIDIL